MGKPAQAVTQAVSHAVTNIATTVKTVITNPSKANIGQIAAVINPITLTAPVDAAQHKEDRPILAAATAIAIGGAYAAGASSATSAATAGTGAASTLGLVKSAAQAPAIIKAAETLTGGGGGGGDGGGGDVPPPSSTLPIFVSPQDYGVWSTGSGGGSGNYYANPAASGTTTPQSNMALYVGGAGFLILLVAMLSKKGR